MFSGNFEHPNLSEYASVMRTGRVVSRFAWLQMKI